MLYIISIVIYIILIIFMKNMLPLHSIFYNVSFVFCFMFINSCQIHKFSRKLI